jgi:hypothetical protein
MVRKETSTVELYLVGIVSFVLDDVIACSTPSSLAIYVLISSHSCVVVAVVIMIRGIEIKTRWLLMLGNVVMNRVVTDCCSWSNGKQDKLQISKEIR